MARERMIEVCALNIAANPHPDGIYTQILNEGSNYIVNARASDWAKITKPRKSSRHDGYYTGRILVWTEINLKGKWLDTRNDEELPTSIKDSINIPSNAKPNYRTFDYVFDVDNHIMYFESRNEFGETFGPTTARRVISQILSQELLGYKSPDVEVTIVPRGGAVDRILAIPGLRSLFIRVTLPNPDLTSTPAKRRVYARMTAANARVMEERFLKSTDASSLTATQEIRDAAEVAGENGYVSGEGRSADGEKVELSTSNQPKRIPVSMERGNSFISRLLSTLNLL